MDLLDAIGQAGEGIDKFTGGRALRGTLAGKPRELLSVLPFSDTLGITDEHDKTSGRDLTDQYGLTAKGDNSFGSHAIGFLADNALSPGNLLGAYGAYKAAPTIAKGITKGAKALSGLDLLDHIGSGAKSLGRSIGSASKGARGFLQGESGALNPSVLYDYGATLLSNLDGIAPNYYQFGEHASNAITGTSNKAEELFGSSPEMSAITQQFKHHAADSARDFAGKMNYDLTRAPFGFDLNNALRGMQESYQNHLVNPLASHLGFDPSQRLGEPFMDAAKKMYYDAAYVRPEIISTADSDIIGSLPNDRVLLYKVASDLANNVPSRIADDLVGKFKKSNVVRDFFGLPPLDNKEFTRAFADSMELHDSASGILMRDLRKGGEANHIMDFLRRSSQNEGMLRDIKGQRAIGWPEYRQGVPIGEHTRDTLENSLREIAMSDPEMLRGWLAPKYGRSIVNGALNDAANQFSRYGDPKDRELTKRFFRVPEIRPDSPDIDLATQIAEKLDNGAVGAKSYFGPDYYHINNHLRNLGPEAYQSEIADILGTRPNREAFKPDQSLVDAFIAKHEMHPYEMMGEASAPYWKEALSKHFGDQAYDYIKHYENLAKSDGSYVGPHEYDPDRIRGHIGNLMGLFDYSGLPEDMNLFRGVDGPGLKKIESILGVPLNSPEAIGKEFIDPGFMSTAYHKPTADAFAGLEKGYNRGKTGVVFDFPSVPAGKPASLMNTSEHEVLFPPGRRIRITDNANYPQIKAELYGTLLAALLGNAAYNRED